MTVAELIETLKQLPPGAPVGVASPLASCAISGAVGVQLRRMRRACDETIEGFSGVVHWFEFGTEQAAWHEERGGFVEEVVTIRG